MVVVLRVSLMINDIEYPFICLLQATVNVLTDHWEGLLASLPVPALGLFDPICPVPL